MPHYEPDFDGSTTAPVPNQGKPETTPAAEAATEHQPPGAEFTRKTPRAVVDILDDLNRVRVELSELYVKKYGPSAGSPRLEGGTYTPHPPITLASIEQDRRMEELERLEGALQAEFRAAKYYMAGTDEQGQPYQGDAIIIGQDKGL